jgi:hypothetical protein
MFKFLLYDNDRYAPQNIAVTVEAIRTRHIALRAESRKYHLGKYM